MEKGVRVQGRLAEGAQEEATAGPVPILPRAGPIRKTLPPLGGGASTAARSMGALNALLEVADAALNPLVQDGYPTRRALCSSSTLP